MRISEIVSGLSSLAVEALSRDEKTGLKPKQRQQGDPDRRDAKGAPVSESIVPAQQEVVGRGHGPAVEVVLSPAAREALSGKISLKPDAYNADS